MNTINLVRQYQGDSGVFGTIYLNSEEFFSGELPWRDNAPDISHIPIGTYQCDFLLSPRFGINLYHIQNVPNRENCLIHMGNWCGDVKKGYRSDVEGCVILGNNMGILEGQEAVLNSVTALTQFNKLLNGESFMLAISESFKD